MSAPPHDPRQNIQQALEARVGSTIAGKFKLTRLLGSGGMGAVYAALNTWTEHRVAIKLLIYAGASPRKLARFFREARIASRIDHPNIVRVFDLGRAEDGTWFIVQELLEGEPMDTRLAHGPLHHQTVLEDLVPIMSALIAAHRNGVVHRDLKPANIVLARPDRAAKGNSQAKGSTASGALRPTLIDFGISKMLDDKLAEGLTGEHLVGTPSYMAPEQAIVEQDVGPWTDVWGMGAVMYRCLTGRPIFEGPGFAVISHIVKDDPIPLRKLAPHVPKQLSRAIHKALRRDYRTRHRSMAAFLQTVLAVPEVRETAWGRDLRERYGPQVASDLSTLPDTPVAEPDDADERRNLEVLTGLEAGSTLLAIVNPDHVLERRHKAGSTDERTTDRAGGTDPDFGIVAQRSDERTTDKANRIPDFAASERTTDKANPIGKHFPPLERSPSAPQRDPRDGQDAADDAPTVLRDVTAMRASRAPSSAPGRGLAVYIVAALVLVVAGGLAVLWFGGEGDERETALEAEGEAPRGEAVAAVELAPHCREWARKLMAEQQQNGGFSGIVALAPTGWATAQTLAALATAEATGCASGHGLDRAFDALDGYREARGWGEFDDGIETPAATWVAVMSAAQLRTDPEASAAAARLAQAYRFLAAEQRADGGFADPSAASSDDYHTVMAAWALVEVEGALATAAAVLPSDAPALPDAATMAAVRARAVGWLRARVDEVLAGGDEPGAGRNALGAVPGMLAQAGHVLALAHRVDGDHADDGARIGAIVARTQTQCGWEGEACTRPLDRNERTQIHVANDQRSGIIAFLWAPWTWFAVEAICADATLPLDDAGRTNATALRASLRTRIAEADAILADENGFVISEWLFVAARVHALGE